MTNDRKRRIAQQGRVEREMSAGKWMTLRALSAKTGDPEASVSARLRDMRKRGWTVYRWRVIGGNGLHEYQAKRANAKDQGADK